MDLEPEATVPQYKIVYPLRYSVGGDFEPVNFVTFVPPTSKHSKLAGYIRQGFMQAMREQLNNDKVMAAAVEAREAAAAAGSTPDESPQDHSIDSEEYNPTEGHDVMNMIAMSEKVDYPAYLDVGKKLLASGVMLYNGSVQPIPATIEKMGLWDLEECVGRYIQNFINTSPS